MNSSNTIRFGGLAYLIAGLSLILLSVFDLAVTDTAVPARAAVHTIAYIGLALGILGLVAIYSVQADKIARLGLIGFTLALVGNSMTAGAAFLNAYIVPIAPDLTAATGPLFTGPAGIVILLSAGLVTAGFVMFGIATMRAGVLPRWAALLVTASAWFGLAAAFAPVAFHVGGVVFGLGNAWLGYAVWSRQGKMDRQGTPAA